jgi:CRISPR/Cas system-associated endonuclease Cas1
MSNPEANTPATDAVKALHFFLQGIEDPSALSPEQLSKELRAAGIDVAKMATQIRKRISQAQNRSRLANNRSRLYRTDPITTVRRTFAELRVAVEQAIERISGIEPQAAAVFYRKLDESTPEDLESLLADILELEADQRGK